MVNAIPPIKEDETTQQVGRRASTQDGNGSQSSSQARPRDGGSETPPSMMSPMQIDEAALDDNAESSESSRRPRTSSSGANSPNARSQTITASDGPLTYGKINQHPARSHLASAPFSVGVSEDKNKKCRRTMEDAHSFIYDFAGVRGQGYFAIFDGHAGKHAAEFCGAHFHEYLLSEISKKQDETVPDMLNSSFTLADKELSTRAAENGTHSGCTAVAAFLRIETEDGKPVPDDLDAEPPQDSVDGLLDDDATPSAKPRRFGDGVHRDKFRSFIGRSSSGRQLSSGDAATEGSSQPAAENALAGRKRTLYTANVGDARAVLSRGGRAIRLTYDHKGSDMQEAKRITDAGGFVLNNRVNGVLAVTRSLGDSSMKEFVVGAPYTTETTLGEEDEFLIIACDGLWDVCEDQAAVDLIKDIRDPQDASKKLLEHALSSFTTDNTTVLVVRLS
ncbi:hypothetical protein E5Q_04462 [Mixia osmundae IAM 14324]|uniref:PPM-type phosphatase domain-containing protein n=1 Tax=Mixia osmundae (strain CBS 9802 / IAM 14324 / JCM 22182 / KY 12970) TaxID=764103 RepID=G7E4M3_MIXOS|nr:hypothetical protein E5Q_04462 [Mixia osmundae IAM 14324]